MITLAQKTLATIKAYTAGRPIEDAHGHINSIAGFAVDAANSRC